MTQEQTTQIVLAIIAGLPTVLAVILAAWVQSRQTKAVVAKVEKAAEENAVGNAEIAKKVEDVVANTDSVSTQTKEVHSAVNSNLSEAKDEIKRLRLVVEGQRDIKLSEATTEIERLRKIVNGIRQDESR